MHRKNCLYFLINLVFSTTLCHINDNGYYGDVDTGLIGILFYISFFVNFQKVQEYR